MTTVSQAQRQAPQEHNLLEKGLDALGDAWKATRDACSSPDTNP